MGSSMFLRPPQQSRINGLLSGFVGGLTARADYLRTASTSPGGSIIMIINPAVIGRVVHSNAFGTITVICVTRALSIGASRVEIKFYCRTVKSDCVTQELGRRPRSDFLIRCVLCFQVRERPFLAGFANVITAERAPERHRRKLAFQIFIRAQADAQSGIEASVSIKFRGTCQQYFLFITISVNQASDAVFPFPGENRPPRFRRVNIAGSISWSGGFGSQEFFAFPGESMPLPADKRMNFPYIPGEKEKIWEKICIN